MTLNYDACIGVSKTGRKKVSGHEFDIIKGKNKQVKVGIEQKQNYSTRNSRLVPHDTTTLALWCLTLEIGRDPVLSPRYGRS